MLYIFVCCRKWAFPSCAIQNKYICNLYMHGEAMWCYYSRRLLLLVYLYLYILRIYTNIRVSEQYYCCQENGNSYVCYSIPFLSISRDMKLKSFCQVGETHQIRTWHISAIMYIIWGGPFWYGRWNGPRNWLPYISCICVLCVQNHYHCTIAPLHG